MAAIKIVTPIKMAIKSTITKSMRCQILGAPINLKSQFLLHGYKGLTCERYKAANPIAIEIRAMSKPIKILKRIFHFILLIR